MNDLNHVILIGRLTRDADLKYNNNGYPIASFSVAVNRSRKQGDQWVEEANFFDITLFGKSAENLKPYLVKGKQVAIAGELRQDRWEQDGQSRSKVVIVANNIQLVGGNTGSSGGNAGGYNQNTAGQNTQRSSYQPRQNAGPAPQGSYNPGPSYGGDSGFPDDIPF